MAISANNEQTPVTSSTSTVAIIGFILAFLIPPIGLILCIVALVQAKKRPQEPKGLAIAGVVVSAIELLITGLIIGIAIFGVVNSNHTLLTYHNNDIGYTVEYPEKWTMENTASGAAKSTIFKDAVKQTGLVHGQEEVVYIPAPPDGYNGDVLNAIRDGFKNTYKNLVISNETRQQYKGLDSLTFVATYQGEVGTLKGKFTIILKKDNSVYTLVTQAPEQNWAGLQDEFYTIHNTFQPQK
jgi:hypothetical protein